MLYVRYGSGCSRMVTGWAPRPSLCRSRQAMSASPSARVRRSPSTALFRMWSMVADKVHPLRGQVQLRRQLIIPPQAGQFGFAQVVADDGVEVPPAVAGVEAEGFRLAFGD